MGHYETCQPGNCGKCGQAVEYCSCRAQKADVTNPPASSKTTPVDLSYDEATCIELMMQNWINGQTKRKDKRIEPALEGLKVLVKKMNDARTKLLEV